MAPTITKYSFIEPRQERSKKRYDKVLEAAEFIYQNLMIQNNLIHGSFSADIKKLLFLGGCLKIGDL